MKILRIIYKSILVIPILLYKLVLNIIAGLLIIILSIISAVLIVVLMLLKWKSFNGIVEYYSTSLVSAVN